MREGLTDQDINRLNDARNRIWHAGYAGFALGGVWGLANCAFYKVVQGQALQHFPHIPYIKSLPRFQNKHFMMWTLVAGACGMFMGASAEGVRSTVSLQDIRNRKTDEAISAGEEIFVHPRFSPNDPEFHVAKASAQSHSRRSEAIEAKRRRDSATDSSKGGGFKAW